MTIPILCDLSIVGNSSHIISSGVAKTAQKIIVGHQVCGINDRIARLRVQVA